MATDERAVEPPLFVQGGKRLSFDRTEPYGTDITDEFVGEGKSEGCVPSCNWEELCALATLVVRHPAYTSKLVDDPPSYYPPRIEEVGS